ncbi:hypothetical protein Tdes44962_MAKER07309 [Teratosphaeria destructans]|uniref:Uncharacterized protein n=1 Tax=Teratosphaeria destructans TaxID=418781 RepID=A0A9W7W6F0_9PEZI|nr:hypothetical protein Tdes44962_MAKER07309 [Teratosphaeria destructans]
MSAPQEGAAPAAQNNEDYLDKALDKGEQMVGKKSGHNIDSTKMRSTNEKITDKLTGKKLPAKVSN